MKLDFNKLKNIEIKLNKSGKRVTPIMHPNEKPHVDNSDIVMVDFIVPNRKNIKRVREILKEDD